MKFKVVIFRGQKYLFDGESLEEDGFIATEENYKAGIASFAHWIPMQGVMRYGQKIGDKKDLKIVGERDVKMDNIPLALCNMLTDPSWEKPV